MATLSIAIIKKTIIEAPSYLLDPLPTTALKDFQPENMSSVADMLSIKMDVCQSVSGTPSSRFG